MKKILIFSLLGFMISGCSVSPDKQSYKNYSTQPLTCKEANARLIASDNTYRNSIDTTLRSFGGLSRKELDEEYCLDNNSVIDKSVVVNKYYQVNKSFVGNKLHVFTAYDLKTHKSLAIILDSSLNTYLVGYKSEPLTRAVMTLINEEWFFAKVDLNSTRTFNDITPVDNRYIPEQDSQDDSSTSYTYKYSNPLHSDIEYSQQPSTKYSPSSYAYRSKTVRVRGYTRKDGTYVRPHTRSAPRSRK